MVGPINISANDTFRPEILYGCVDYNALNHLKAIISPPPPPSAVVGVIIQSSRLRRTSLTFCMHRLTKRPWLFLNPLLVCVTLRLQETPSLANYISFRLKKPEMNFNGRRTLRNCRPNCPDSTGPEASKQFNFCDINSSTSNGLKPRGCSLKKIRKIRKKSKKSKIFFEDLKSVNLIWEGTTFRIQC